PARPVHHPEEVWLDPTHPGVAEVPTKRAMLGRVPANGRVVGLIDDDGFGVVLGEDVAALLWPHQHLLWGRLRDQGHWRDSLALPPGGPPAAAKGTPPGR